MYRTLLLCFLCTALFVNMQGQTGKRDTIPPPPPPVTEDVEDADNIIFDRVEVEAAFPGGDNMWRNYLSRNLNPEVPVQNNAPAGKYTVIVQFIVDRDGKISDVKALTNHGYGMEKEVIRVIKKGPDWTPAIQNGRVVKAYRKQPVTFEVVEEKRKRKNKS